MAGTSPAMPDAEDPKAGAAFSREGRAKGSGNRAAAARGQAFRRFAERRPVRAHAAGQGREADEYGVRAGGAVRVLPLGGEFLYRGAGLSGSNPRTRRLRYR